MQPTPLYHAAVIGGPTGLSFQIGAQLLFAPVNEERLYLVEVAQLLVTAEVEPAKVAFLTATILEPRLLALAGGGR
jgi:hypothetical protein